MRGGEGLRCACVGEGLRCVWGEGGGLIVVFTFSVLTQRLYRDLATCSDSNTAKSSFDRSSTEQTHTQRERDKKHVRVASLYYKYM